MRDYSAHHISLFDRYDRYISLDIEDIFDVRMPFMRATHEQYILYLMAIMVSYKIKLEYEYLSSEYRQHTNLNREYNNTRSEAAPGSVIVYYHQLYINPDRLEL